MKLIKMMVAFAAMLSLALLTGCGVKNQPPSPQQVAAIACPQINLVHVQLTALNAALVADPATAAIGKQAQAQLDTIHPIVMAVCHGAAAAPAVNLANLKTLVTTGLPALGHLASTLPLPPAQQAQVQAALVVAETAAGVVGIVVQQVQGAQPVAGNPAAAASAAKP